MSIIVLNSAPQTHVPSKEQAIRELFSITTKAVIFLNSQMEIIRINEYASKKFTVQNTQAINFELFSKINSLNNTFHFGADISTSIKETIARKLRISDSIPYAKPTTWRVEYFPELFETDFKLGLVEITEEQNRSADKLFSHAVFESVNSIVQSTTVNQNFDAVLYNIIKSLPGRAHVKLATDLSYHITNEATLKLLGMNNAQQLIGKNDYDIGRHMGSHWPAKLAQELQDLDNEIINNNKPIIGKEETPYLDAEGNLVIHSLTKIPIYNLSNQPYGVLTLAADITNIKDVMFVRQSYNNLFKKPKQAHYHFIKHIGLDKIHADQDDLITIRELECLILFTKGMATKEIARRMNISPRTVETHFEHVKTKFNCLTRSEVISLFLAHCKF